MAPPVRAYHGTLGLSPSICFKTVTPCRVSLAADCCFALGGLMHKADMDSLAGRIASMRFAVVLLAEVMEVQGLATRTEIRDMLGTAATKPTRAATVAKALSAISQRVEQLEERATKERWPALQVVKP
jgi:hypothetical protein